MDPNTATEYAFKNGYKQALEHVLQLNLVPVEIINELLAQHHIDPFNN